MSAEVFVGRQQELSGFARRSTPLAMVGAAFSLIKAEGLDEVESERMMREARAMGRLTHADIVSIGMQTGR